VPSASWASSDRDDPGLALSCSVIVNRSAGR
jgi:hypothetical protein